LALTVAGGDAIDIETANLVTRLHQVERHGHPHLSEADPCNYGHLIFLQFIQWLCVPSNLVITNKAGGSRQSLRMDRSFPPCGVQINTVNG
jgi:hypothetical protein